MTAPASLPKVVALVPAWSAEAFIAGTLDALEAQTHPNLEILISDDASPDETAAICERYAARDGRFRIIRQAANLGWTGNVNFLLREAQGDYLFFAFHDDLPAPDYVEKCVARLEANPAAIIAFSDIALVQRDGSTEEHAYERLDGVSSRLERARRVAGRRGHWWIPNRGVFRAPAAAAIGGLRRHMAGEFSADLPWLLYMSLLGEFVRIPEILVTKIYQEQSLSRQWKFGVWPWFAVALSGAGSVWRSDIRGHEKALLMVSLAGLVLREARRSTRKAVGRWARRMGLYRGRGGPEPGVEVEGR